jgi:hypothetical protein
MFWANLTPFSLKGAEGLYRHGVAADGGGGAVVRRETAAMAREADDRLLAAWRGHPRHC